MRIALLSVGTVLLSCVVHAGGELPYSPPREKGFGPAPTIIKGRAIERPKIGPLGSGLIQKDAPLPAPYRPVGWGFKCNEFYGPTYYDPSYHNVYERLHPQYYPFYHPRLWPNYKSPGQYREGAQCGSSRSGWYWDSYDDWKRDSRYGEHQ